MFLFFKVFLKKFYNKIYLKPSPLSTIEFSFKSIVGNDSDGNLSTITCIGVKSFSLKKGFPNIFFILNFSIK